MGLQLQQAWKNNESPYKLCTPARDFMTTMVGHGYTVYYYPDLSHQLADPPEDHTAYSATGYPDRSPYGYGFADDLMPHPDPKMPSLSAIARLMIAHKNAGRPELAPLKYLNWTDDQGYCWHDTWTPNFARRSSTDRGHNHTSWRTDYQFSTLLAGYDPVAEILGSGNTMSVVVRCTENGGYYSYPVPKWFRSAAAANTAAVAYGTAVLVRGTLAEIRDQFGYIPGDAAAVAAGQADVVADAHGNVLPSAGGGGGVTADQSRAIAREEIGHSAVTPRP